MHGVYRRVTDLTRRLEGRQETIVGLFLKWSVEDRGLSYASCRPLLSSSLHHSPHGFIIQRDRVDRHCRPNRRVDRTPVKADDRHV